MCCCFLSLSMYFCNPFSFDAQKIFSLEWFIQTMGIARIFLGSWNNWKISNVCWWNFGKSLNPWTAGIKYTWLRCIYCSYKVSGNLWVMFLHFKLKVQLWTRNNTLANLLLFLIEWPQRLLSCNNFIDFFILLWKYVSFFFGWSLPGYAHGSDRMSFCIVNLPNTCCCIDFCHEICLVFIEFFNFLLLFVFYILSRKIWMKYLNEEWCLKFCKLWIDKILK